MFHIGFLKDRCLYKWKKVLMLKGETLMLRLENGLEGKKIV